MNLRVLIACMFVMACGGSSPQPESPTVVAPPETTSLTYRLRVEGPATPAAHISMEALGAALKDAGYRIVVDPAAPHDAEILCQAFSRNDGAGFPDNNRQIPPMDRVYLTATVTSQGRVIDRTSLEFLTSNLQITTAHVRPAVKSFNASPKLAQLGRELRGEAPRP